MELTNEYALLVVVALPAAVIIAMNLVLGLAGESGTLLLPSRDALPASRIDAIDVTPAMTSSAPVVEAANDEMRTAA